MGRRAVAFAMTYRQLPVETLPRIVLRIVEADTPDD